MSKPYLIMLAPKYPIIVNTEESHLTDPTSARFITGEKDGKKYFINRNRILFFREYDKETDEIKGKQF